MDLLALWVVGKGCLKLASITGKIPHIELSLKRTDRSSNLQKRMHSRAFMRRIRIGGLSNDSYKGATHGTGSHRPISSTSLRAGRERYNVALTGDARCTAGPSYNQQRQMKSHGSHRVRRKHQQLRSNSPSRPEIPACSPPGQRSSVLIPHAILAAR